MEHPGRPWTAFYRAGARVDIAEPAYRNLADMIRAMAETYGRAPAFTCCLPNGMNGTLSYAQVDEMSDALAAYLREVAGLKQGDRVAVQMPNCLSFPVAAFGRAQAGLACWSTSTRSTRRGRMAKQFEDPNRTALHHRRHVRRQGGPPGHRPNHLIPRDTFTRWPSSAGPARPASCGLFPENTWDKSVKRIRPPISRLADAIAAGPRPTSPGTMRGRRLTTRPSTPVRTSPCCKLHRRAPPAVSKGAM